jgi:hypothetical protein
MKDKNYKSQNTNYKGGGTPSLLGITNYSVRNYTQKIKGSHGLHRDTFKLQTMTALIKSFCGGGESVNQWVSGSVGQLDDRQAQLGNQLITVPRPHPETNENQHRRFAQHIGSPRRGAPGCRRQKGGQECGFILN